MQSLSENRYKLVWRRIAIKYIEYLNIASYWPISAKKITSFFSSLKLPQILIKKTEQNHLRDLNKMSKLSK